MLFHNHKISNTRRTAYQLATAEGDRQDKVSATPLLFQILLVRMANHSRQNLVSSKIWYLAEIIKRWKINRCLIWSGHSLKQVTKSKDQVEEVPARTLSQHQCQTTQWQTESILWRRTTTCKPLLWLQAEQWMAANKRSIQILEAWTTAPVAGSMKSLLSKSLIQACTKTEEERAEGRSEMEHQTT